MPVLLAIIIDIVVIFINAVVLKILWGWYMVSIFTLPNLTIPQSIGITLVVSLMTHEFISRNDDKETICAMIYDSITIPILALIIGGITVLFM